MLYCLNYLINLKMCVQAPVQTKLFFSRKYVLPQLKKGQCTNDMDCRKFTHIVINLFPVWADMKYIESKNQLIKKKIKIV